MVGYATVDGARWRSPRSARARQGRRSTCSSTAASRPARSQPQDLLQGCGTTPQTFNSFYIDNKHIAEYTSGLLPMRPRARRPGPADRRAPASTSGGLPAGSRHPSGTDPSDGTMVNWNNSVARGFGAADNEWGAQWLGRARRHAEQQPRPPAQRRQVDARHGDLGDERGGHPGRARDRHRAVAGEGAQGIAGALRAGAADAEPAGGLARPGGSRLDRDLDGKDRRSRCSDHGRAPGRRSPTRSWRRCSAPQLDELNALFTRFDHPPRGQYNGWYQYFDRDIRALLGHEGPEAVRQRLLRQRQAAPASSDVDGDRGAGKELAAEQGTANPAAWRRARPPSGSSSLPGCCRSRMRYTNRPSGIQQVISFDGHR